MEAYSHTYRERGEKEREKTESDKIQREERDIERKYMLKWNGSIIEVTMSLLDTRG